MYWIHPLWQSSTIILALYVLHLGWSRFAASHLGRAGLFPWKRHVALGKAVIFMWLYGAAVGAAAAWVKWRSFGTTGAHFLVAGGIVTLISFGYGSGWLLDAHKKNRPLLPYLHGGANLLAVLLSLFSAFSGSRILAKYFLS